MVGFTLLSRSYYFLRRRSPAPPFPPDHRQAGERGATIRLTRHRVELSAALLRKELHGRQRFRDIQNPVEPSLQGCCPLGVPSDRKCPPGPGP